MKIKAVIHEVAEGVPLRKCVIGAYSRCPSTYAKNMVCAQFIGAFI